MRIWKQSSKIKQQQKIKSNKSPELNGIAQEVIKLAANVDPDKMLAVLNKLLKMKLFLYNGKFEDWYWSVRQAILR